MSRVMQRWESIECVILGFVLDYNDPRGRYPAQLVTLRNIIVERVGECGEDEVLDAIKRLQLRKCLDLQKWDDSKSGFRDYMGTSDDNEFFYRGDFRLVRTPYTRRYFEENYAEGIPKERKIGFQG